MATRKRSAAVAAEDRDFAEFSKTCDLLDPLIAKSYKELSEDREAMELIDNDPFRFFQSGFRIAFGIARELSKRGGPGGRKDRYA